MTSSLTKDVARVVRGIMAIRGVQQKDVVAATGAPSSSVSRWLKGGTFDTDTLETLASALGMEADHLVRLALLSRSVTNGELTALLATVEEHTEPPRQERSERRPQTG